MKEEWELSSLLFSFWNPALRISFMSLSVEWGTVCDHSCAAVSLLSNLFLQMICRRVFQ